MQIGLKPNGVPPHEARGVPRDAVEAQLCDIWRVGLGLPDIGVHEDFFDAGGDSLFGIRILNEVERLFGVDLNLVDFFTAGTVAAVAELIRGYTTRPRSNILVRLQAGQGRPPVYVFHPLPGTVLGYTDFARAMPEYPVWGLQSPGTDPAERPLEPTWPR